MIGLLLTHPIHVRAWISSRMAARIADRWPLRFLMPGPLAEMARPWLPDKCELVVTHGCQGGPIRRRIREALRLGSMVAWEPESVTYRHKLGQKR